MDTIKENSTTAVQQEEQGYAPRPVWQVWGARIGLVIFLGFVVLQLLTIAGGGL